MVNNYDKMKSVQTTLDNLSAGASETVETSGTVTAVTPGEEDGTGDTPGLCGSRRLRKQSGGCPGRERQF